MTLSIAALAVSGMGKPMSGETPTVGSLNDLGRVPFTVDPGQIGLTLEDGTPLTVINAVNGPLWWSNGGPDLGPSGNAQASQVFGTFDARTADDFVITECTWVHMDRIELVMAVSSQTTPAAELIWYDDCDGKPGTVIEVFPMESATAVAGSPWPGFTLYNMTFLIDRFLDGPQRIWITPIGNGAGQYYWVSADTFPIVQGVQAQYKAAAFGYPDWTDVVDVINLEQCTDFNFSIYGDCCYRIQDNGDYDLVGVESLKFPNQMPFGARGVDNFQLRPGTGPVELCRIEGYLATNCDPSRTIVEIYANDCDRPGALLATLEDPIVIDTGDVYAGNPSIPVYCFVWQAKGTLLALDEGQNYWISVVAVGTGNINERGYFLFKQKETCGISITEGLYKNPFFGFPEFTPVSDPALGGQARDFAFRVYGKCPNDMPGTSVPVGGSANPLFADLNGDGTVDTDDLGILLGLFGSSQ
jgi:hypothetical protein